MKAKLTFVLIALACAIVNISRKTLLIHYGVLGDSYAAAFQVPMENAFWAIAEREVAECPHRPIEVLNFGLSGYGTAQQLLTLRHRGWEYPPDYLRGLRVRLSLFAKLTIDLEELT